MWAPLVTVGKDNMKVTDFPLVCLVKVLLLKKLRKYWYKYKLRLGNRLTHIVPGYTKGHQPRSNWFAEKMPKGRTTSEPFLKQNHWVNSPLKIYLLTKTLNLED